jgi:hypothetical protein
MTSDHEARTPMEEAINTLIPDSAKCVLNRIPPEPPTEPRAHMVCHDPTATKNPARHGIVVLFAEDVNAVVVQPLTHDPARLAEYVASLVGFLYDQPAWIDRISGTRAPAPSPSTEQANSNAERMQ